MSWILTNVDINQSIQYPFLDDFFDDLQLDILATFQSGRTFDLVLPYKTRQFCFSNLPKFLK